MKKFVSILIVCIMVFALFSVSNVFAVSDDSSMVRVFNSVGLIGIVDGYGGWDEESYQLTYENGIWSTVLEFTGEENNFKARVDGDWTISFGNGLDGEDVSNYKEFLKGTYKISIKDGAENGSLLSVVKLGSKFNSVGLIGIVDGSGDWIEESHQLIYNDGIWSIVLEFTGGENNFKARADGEWTISFGTGGNGEDVSNYKETLIGKYKISIADGAEDSTLLTVEAIAEDEAFIQKHLEFIGAKNDNNTYHNLLTHCDLSQIALEDYGDLDDTYNLWKAVRGEIFDNPYYVVLADMIMGEESAQGQLESFDVNLDSNWRSITNDVMGLINSKVELTPTQESKIKKMFKNKDFSDETTFKLLEDIFGNKISKNELNSIFNAYDKTNTFIDIFNKGANIVNSVVDTINYSAILKSYADTSDEFKVVLMQIAYSCQMENPWLYTAIDKYLNSDYDTEMRNKIIEEVAKNGLDIGETLFKEAIVNKVKNFLISNMDLSKVGAKVASSVLAFVQGAEIGKSIGIGIDNILFNTDDVTNSYVTASATAKTAEYLKFVLENNEALLRNNPTIENTCLFCETFYMYKNTQLNVADTMITYFYKNQSALINKIFKSNNVAYESQIYNWHILKLNWQNASCHKGYILKSSIKNITVACPVDIIIYNKSGEIALQIVNNEVVHNNGEIVATVCNNIKYITLPDDSYNVKITATDDGVMSYSILDCSVLDNVKKTVCFDDIKIVKDKEYTGEIILGDTYTQDDVALHSDDTVVDSKVVEYTDENRVEVTDINLNVSSIKLRIGENKTVSVDVFPQNASNKIVSWYSENPDIAQVDEYGNVTGVSVGETSIVCVSLNGNVKSICDVLVDSIYSIGDVNGDGGVTIDDVTLIQKYLASMVELDSTQLKAADVTGDSDVSIDDVTKIQKFIAGLISSLSNV